MKREINVKQEFSYCTQESNEQASTANAVLVSLRVMLLQSLSLPCIVMLVRSMIGARIRGIAKAKLLLLNNLVGMGRLIQNPISRLYTGEA